MFDIVSVRQLLPSLLILEGVDQGGEVAGLLPSLEVDGLRLGVDRPEELDAPDDGKQGGEGGVDDNLTFPPGALCQDIYITFVNICNTT